MPCQWCKEWRTPDYWDGKDYSIEVLCMSEPRWINSGRRRLSIGHTILFSCRTDNHHSNGVAIIVNRMVKKTILVWKPINITCSSRHDWTPSLLKWLWLSVMHQHMMRIKEEIKDEFYDQLEEAIRTTPQHDMLLVAGDLMLKLERITLVRKNEGYAWLWIYQQ